VAVASRVGDRATAGLVEAERGDRCLECELTSLQSFAGRFFRRAAAANEYRDAD
jgi:hypothetical protein